MGLFRRRPPAGERVVVAPAAVRTIAPPPEPGGLVTGWGAVNVLPSSAQVGMFTGSTRTMRGGATLEVQKRQGVEGLSAGWMVPQRLDASTAWAITQHVGNAAGYQRVVGGNTGQLGPITARTMRANVTAQAIRQSGASAVAWAQSLSPLAGN